MNLGSAKIIKVLLVAAVFRCSLRIMLFIDQLEFGEFKLSLLVLARRFQIATLCTVGGVFP